MGGDNFAVACSSCDRADWDAYKPISGTGQWMTTQGMPQWWEFYSPIPLKLISFDVKVNTTYAMTQAVFQGSNDNNTWEDLKEFSTIYGENVEINSTKYFKYHRIYVTRGGVNYTNYTGLMPTVSFVAYSLTNITKSITFPQAYSNTNYSFATSCTGKYNESYAKTKTASGIILEASQSTEGSMNYISIGY